jgi:hypothetical protein
MSPKQFLPLNPHRLVAQLPTVLSSQSYIVDELLLFMKVTVLFLQQLLVWLASYTLSQETIRSNI